MKLDMARILSAKEPGDKDIKIKIFDQDTCTWIEVDIKFFLIYEDCIMIEAGDIHSKKLQEDTC